MQYVYFYGLYETIDLISGFTNAYNYNMHIFMCMRNIYLKRVLGIYSSESDRLDGIEYVDNSFEQRTIITVWM